MAVMPPAKVGDTLSLSELAELLAQHNAQGSLPDRWSWYERLRADIEDGTIELEPDDSVSREVAAQWLRDIGTDQDQIPPGLRNIEPPKKSDSLNTNTENTYLDLIEGAWVEAGFIPEDGPLNNASLKAQGWSIDGESAESVDAVATAIAEHQEDLGLKGRSTKIKEIFKEIEFRRASHD